MNGPEAEAKMLGELFEAEDLVAARAHVRARVEIDGVQQGLHDEACRHADGGIASCLRETDGLADGISARAALPVASSIE